MTGLERERKKCQRECTDKNDFGGEVNTTEKNNVIYMKKVSSGKNLKK